MLTGRQPRRIAPPSSRIVALALAAVLSIAGCTGTSSPTPGTAPSTSSAAPSTGAPSGTAIPAPTPPRLPVGVSQRAVLGDPWSRSQRKVHAVADSALAMVSRARRGQTLTLSMFNLTYPSATGTLLRASRRGVAVRVLLNREGARSKQARTLIAGLGTNRKARSWVVVRPGGVRMHSKFLLVAGRGSKGPTVWVSSGNLTTSNGRDQANEALITIGDQELYDFLLTQFTLMRTGVTSPRKLGRTATTSATVVRSFPVPEGGVANDPILAVLNDVSCRHGGDRTVVRMAQLFLTVERLYVSRRLRELAAQGCEMRIVGHMRGWNPKAVQRLLGKGRGHVDLRSATGRILHTKITSVDGWNAAGARIDIAMVGSHNLTGRALARTPEGVNDELSLRIWDEGTVDTYNRWIDRVIAKHSTRAKVP